MMGPGKGQGKGVNPLTEEISWDLRLGPDVA